MEFTGTALITGAGSGIGQALALLYAQRGCANLALADVRAEAIKETVQMIRKAAPNVKLLELVVDVADEHSVQSMIDQTVKDFGTIEYAANVAGVSRGPSASNAKVADYTLRDYDRVMDINARGVLLCVQAELRVMLQQQISGKQRGSIVNVASVAGLHALPSMLGYIASKHCVLGVTKTAALDYARQAVRINAVCPGYIGTPMLMNSYAATGMNQNVTAASVPMGRLGGADEVAEVCAFLTSARSSFVTGASYVVDGGGQAGYGWHQAVE